MAALRLLDRGKQLMDSADFGARRGTPRVIGFDDLAVTSAGLLGLGNALHRLDRDADALQVWNRSRRWPILRPRIRPGRNVAAARVRAGDNAARSMPTARRSPRAGRGQGRDRQPARLLSKEIATPAQPGGISPDARRRGHRVQLRDHRDDRGRVTAGGPVVLAGGFVLGDSCGCTRSRSRTASGGALSPWRWSTPRCSICRSTSCSTCTSCGSPGDRGALYGVAFVAIYVVSALGARWRATRRDDVWRGASGAIFGGRSPGGLTPPPPGARPAGPDFCGQLAA